MKKSIQVGASILCADFTRLKEEIKKCEDAGIDMIHVDVMDGHFVPVITIGQLIVEAIRPLTRLPIDAHLMVEYPFMHIDHFINAGADIISIHAECYGQWRRESQGIDRFPKEVDAMNTEMALADIRRIKEKGKKVFMAINPGTPLCIHSVLDALDGVMIMSVNPGFAKQKFMPVALSKIQELRNQFDGDIAVDGGINKETAPEVVKAGANLLATASYFFGSADFKQAVKYLKTLV
ncbi:MAG TPA: ribulose-phosphate 3-epimerase [Candidatus Omnitrophota bacterium]|nr:ribulose-phosphate 3-epimerase [Candidatus Omnitrophota bacterium]